MLGWREVELFFQVFHGRGATYIIYNQYEIVQNFLFKLKKMYMFRPVWGHKRSPLGPKLWNKHQIGPMIRNICKIHIFRLRVIFKQIQNLTELNLIELHSILAYNVFHFDVVSVIPSNSLIEVDTHLKNSFFLVVSSISVRCS